MLLHTTSLALLPGYTSILAAIMELLCQPVPGKQTQKAKTQIIRNSSPWKGMFEGFFATESTHFYDFHLIMQCCTDIKIQILLYI